MSENAFITSWQNFVILAAFFVAAYLVGLLLLRALLIRLRESVNVQFNLGSASVEIERGRSLLHRAESWKKVWNCCGCG